MFCGHEYTAANLRFALAVEPDNRAALEYQGSVARLRDADAPSLPSRMALEIRRSIRFCAATNRRCGTRPSGSGRPASTSAAEVFGVFRAWKDQFR